MEPLSPQVMHKLVFTILVHGLPDAQTGLALDVLLDAQSNPNPQVRELAVVALAELPVAPARRVTGLVNALRDPSSRVRRRAARALGDFGVYALPAIQALTTALRDPDPSVRRDAAGSLGRFGPSSASAVPALVPMLGDPETRTRVVVATTLKRIGGLAIPGLLVGFRYPDPELRARVTTLIAKIAPQDDAVIAALREATADQNEEVRTRASEALDAVTIPLATAGI
ncbi:HEAT repeat domain-containing protein [Gemmata sp.]|uniref:HEAT repeat domain-containing protein n=1 Tax=Gemmata sp. TaxID=1914242 RepID=UPI003F70CB8E